MSKELNNQEENKVLYTGGVIWRKFLPFIPILGIPLAAIYHRKFGDTGIENNSVNLITAIIQAISICALVFYVI